jgi:hypothetical protein
MALVAVSTWSADTAHADAVPSLAQLPATRPVTAVSAGDGSGTRLGPWRADYRFGVINGFGGGGLATVTEGIDDGARTGELRVEVDPPAVRDLTTTVYDYRRA